MPWSLIFWPVNVAPSFWIIWLWSLARTWQHRRGPPCGSDSSGTLAFWYDTYDTMTDTLSWCLVNLLAPQTSGIKFSLSSIVITSTECCSSIGSTSIAPLHSSSLGAELTFETFFFLVALWYCQNGNLSRYLCNFFIFSLLYLGWHLIRSHTDAEHVWDAKGSRAIQVLITLVMSNTKRRFWYCFWNKNQNVLVSFPNLSYWKQLVSIWSRICSPGPNRNDLFQ